MSHPPNQPPNQPLGHQPGYGPQAGQPQPPSSPAYGAPAPAYGPPGSSALGYDPPASGAPAYGPPGSSAPAYGAPGYGPPGAAPRPPRANPLAGILLIVGGLAGLSVGVLPWVGVDLPGIIAAVNIFSESGPYSGISDTSLKIIAIALFATVLGALVTLVAGARMFGARPHRGASTAGLIGSALLLIAGLTALIVSEGQMLDGAGAMPWIMLFCGVPAILGTIAGFAIT